MYSRTLLRHAMVLLLALLAGAVSATSAATEEPTVTTASDEANELVEQPAKAPTPPRPSAAPT